MKDNNKPYYGKIKPSKKILIKTTNYDTLF